MELNEIKCSVCPHKVDKRKLAAVMERMCDEYCRFHYKSGFAQEKLDKICEHCPMNELVDK